MLCVQDPLCTSCSSCTRGNVSSLVRLRLRAAAAQRAGHLEAMGARFCCRDDGGRSGRTNLGR